MNAPPDVDVELGGAQLLDDVRASIGRYVILPTERAYDAVTLWIAATHAATALWHFPRLAIRSPEKRCGKTRLLDIVHALSRNPIPTANISSAVLYRVMGGKDPSTLLIDEADVIWGSKKAAENNDDLRGLVNAGFERDRPTLRYNASTRQVEELETFGFVALAGIGGLPDTITDRAVNIVMRRRAAGEVVAPFRSKRDGKPLEDLRDRLHAWVTQHLAEIEAAAPELPVEDRAADVWESLVVIADLAGGHWPIVARLAAQILSREHDQDDTDFNDGVTLLADIRRVYDFTQRAFIPSKELVAGLRMLDDSPWGAEYDLTVTGLSVRLRNYGVRPDRDTTGSVRGYRREWFTDAWSRYLPVKNRQAVKSAGQPSDGSDGSDTSDGSPVKAVSALSSESDDLTGSDTCPACKWPYGSDGHAINCSAGERTAP